jgi:hypothetical protein
MCAEARIAQVTSISFVSITPYIACSASTTGVFCYRVRSEATVDLQIKPVFFLVQATYRSFVSALPFRVTWTCHCPIAKPFSYNLQVSSL